MELQESKFEESVSVNPLRSPVTDETEATSSSFQILFVDDEEGVRDLMAWILSRAGFDVEVAANGQEGLELFKKSAFDLVLTDYNMPVMNGLVLAQKIKSLAPRTPVGMVTGFDKRRAQEILDDNVVEFLILKPFRVEEVQDKIKQVLDASRQSTVSSS